MKKKIALDKSNFSHFRNLILTDNFKKVFPDRNIYSCYFDTVDYQMYQDSIEGTVPRKKIRLRSYNKILCDEVFFEIKINSVEGRFKTVKKINDYKNIMNKGFFDPNYGICYPKLIVRYKRSYLQKKNIRVTLDENISFSRYNKSNKFIFSKYNNYDCAEIKCKTLDDLDEFDLNQVQTIRNSKYCNGINEILKDSSIYTDPF